MYFRGFLKIALPFMVVTLEMMGTASATCVGRLRKNYNKLSRKSYLEVKRMVPNPNRIVGGKRAHEGEFPYAVSLQNYKTLRHFCGGSLISSRHVLTACHCLTYRTNSYRPRLKPARIISVLIGALDVDAEATEWRGKIQRRRGTSSVAHPKCAKLPSGLIFDVGVLYVTPFYLIPGFVEALPRGSFTGFKRIEPITNTSETHTVTCTAIGWGSLKEKGSLSSELMKVDLKLLSQSDCALTLDPYAASVAPDLEFSGQSQFCSLGNNKDACTGDSGGPLLCGLPGVPHDMVVGIASWGIGCARQNVPGIWGRIDVAEDWINETLLTDSKGLARGVNTLSTMMCLINLYFLFRVSLFSVVFFFGKPW